MSHHSIRSVGHRMILDSHAGFTTEYVVELEDGARGVGSSSRGETISVYEDPGSAVDPARIVETMRRDGIIGLDIEQATLDGYLLGKIDDFGKNTCFAISLAFFDADRNASGGMSGAPCEPPRLCLNVLNGGWHAYTNPVLSDFSEFMIVPKNRDLIRTLKDHNLVQDVVRERLLGSGKTVVNGNPVNSFSERTNEAPLRFLVEILEELGLRDDYELMIDASASDLRADGGYGFPITDDSRRTSEEMLSYWSELIERFSLGFLEDPFHEKDYESWKQLTRVCGDRCRIVGDNFYSSEAARIEQGSREGYSTVVIVKPNQAGTVSATFDAIEAATAGGQQVMTSHRSISTESTFVCDVTCMYNVPYIKIGPLLTDYSSIVRLNQLIRLSGGGHE